MSARDSQVGGTHYADKPIQPWDAMKAWMTPDQFEGFLRGNAIKYLARHGSKGKSEDVKKAIHYCQMVLEMEYGIQSTVDYSEAGVKQERMQKAVVK